MSDDTTITRARRSENWPALLAQFIEERRAMPFAWRDNDCALGFVCGWIVRCTGVDIVAKYADRYSDALSAARLLKEAGGVEEIAAGECAALDWPEVPLKRAHRGDVVSFDGDHGTALGVCLGSVVAFPGPDGVAFVPLKQCRRAWRIG